MTDSWLGHFKMVVFGVASKSELLQHNWSLPNVCQGKSNRIATGYDEWLGFLRILLFKKKWEKSRQNRVIAMITSNK